MLYKASDSRYEKMRYNRCGASGLKLPAVSLGLWHNFGDIDTFQNSREMALKAFDLGITHFDLANNYGPPPGSAEENFGRILRRDLKPYRDEILVSSKAGHRMWPGPYGDLGSRKYLVASLDQSLMRLGMEYVDIFYHHRPDPNTPIHESMSALDYIVRSGRALYVGISNYSAEQTKEAASILRQLGTPCLIHQPPYNMFKRGLEGELLQTLAQEKIGCITFSPLAQGLLTDKYLDGIPADTRFSRFAPSKRKQHLSEQKLEKVRQLNDMALQRGQTLAQMALLWNLRHPVVTSVLIGASNVSQIEDSAGALDAGELSKAEINAIDEILD